MQVWDRAFPDVFTPRDQAPAELQRHFRYPENLFQAQAFHFANYHVQDPAGFYRKQDFWEIPVDPTLQPAATLTDASTPSPDASGRKLLPSYQLMKLPGDAEERFHLVIPFQPENRLNMVGWMAVNSDPGRIRGARRVHLPVGTRRRWARPGLLADQLRSGILRGQDPPGLGRLRGAVRRSPDDPDRGFDPVRAADVRPRRSGSRGPRAEARDGRERIERLRGSIAPRGDRGSHGRHQRRRAGRAAARWWHRHRGAAGPAAAHAGGAALRRGGGSAAERRSRHLPIGARAGAGTGRARERTRGRIRGRADALAVREPPSPAGGIPGRPRAPRCPSAPSAGAPSSPSSSPAIA